ncbi:protein of unknown function [Candidatus Filomicrobium marinum]|uniref:Uncharacterized protein n=1 Tax=Candidatus Filomicrobium marinum TaxID=1608628 RepID=A0A0D6JCS4_9HYPH|nr:protein of unknown function [Candidatus Filomicrobium marinum]CPR16724.1 protein of unknown function [Candidatus Filomicrobium marinum]
MLFGNSLGDFGPIDGMNGVKQRDGFLGFIGLQRSNQMQGYIWELVTQGWPFAGGFLDPIFAEVALAGVQNGQDFVWAEGFGDDDQLDVSRGATDVFRGGGDLIFDGA